MIGDDAKKDQPEAAPDAADGAPASLPNAAAEPLATAWDQDPADGQMPEGSALIIDVEGFEGPMDLLLAMARTQKVDIAQISILKLVEQYLKFIAELKQLRLEVAADYLVMAAWLAFLKSRLLLPREDDDGEDETAEMLAARLAFRLQRLDAMRNAAAQLMTRPRLGRDVFARGQPEGFKTIRETQFTAKFYDLLKAYADQRQRTVVVTHVVKMRTVWSIQDARARLERMIGRDVSDWVQLDLFLERFVPTREELRTAAASSFGATLEMARDGLLEIHQDEPFGPIYLRHRIRDDDPAPTTQ